MMTIWNWLRVLGLLEAAAGLALVAWLVLS